MRKAKVEEAKNNIELGKPGITPEEEENQCIALAYNLAKKRLIEGTATSQEVTHFLKLGSSKTKIEKEILLGQKELNAAKADSLRSNKRNEEMLEEVKKALQRYKGEEDEYECDEDIY